MTMQRDTLSFMIAQTAHVEREVYQTEYEEISYPTLVMVDETASDYASAVVHFSSNFSGQPALLNQRGGDIPQVDTQMAEHVVGVHEFGLGYSHTVTEIQQAMMAGRDLAMDKPRAAGESAELRLQRIFEVGIPEINLTGFVNDANVTVVAAAEAADGNNRDWPRKTVDEIIKDVSEAMGSIYQTTERRHLPNTLVLPTAAAVHIASRRIDDSDITVLDYIRRNNAYTQLTAGMPLQIRALGALDTAATGTLAGQGRLLMYRSNPNTLKFHLPMAYRLSQPYMVNGFQWRVDGMFRTAGLEVKIPGAMRYVDGIWPAP